MPVGLGFGDWKDDPLAEVLFRSEDQLDFIPPTAVEILLFTFGMDARRAQRSTVTMHRPRLIRIEKSATKRAPLQPHAGQYEASSAFRRAGLIGVSNMLGLNNAAASKEYSWRK